MPPLSHESLMLSSMAAEDGDRGSDVGSLKFVPYENPDSFSGFYGFIDQVDYLLLLLLYFFRCHRLCIHMVKILDVK